MHAKFKQTTKQCIQHGTHGINKLTLCHDIHAAFTQSHSHTIHFDKHLSLIHTQTGTQSHSLNRTLTKRPTA